MISDFNAMFLATHPEIAKKILREGRKRQRVLVMALKPKYAKAIYEGRKNWEFRKAPPPLFKEIFIYESAPVSKITGTVWFEQSVTGIPEAVYYMVKGNKCYTKNLAGISLEYLEEYAKGSKVAALRVGEAKRLDHDVALDAKPPQNWGTFYAHPKTAEKGAS